MMTLSVQSERVAIQAGKVEMEGILRLPEDPIGIILFVHGGVANRVNPPNDYVASVLRNARLGTLWMNLLTAQEARSSQMRCDIPMLADRLNAAYDWLRRYGSTRDVPIGLFGASNGAAAVLHLAATQGRGICAIVSRGGRPDLAGQSLLGKISAPTLLIVGELDDGVVETNRAAYAALRCKKRFEIIPGATHAFEESGNLEVVARLARGWFLQHSRYAYV
jgi:putative phosphoribosyl transferase